MKIFCNNIYYLYYIALFPWKSSKVHLQCVIFRWLGLGYCYCRYCGFWVEKIDLSVHIFAKSNVEAKWKCVNETNSLKSWTDKYWPSWQEADWLAMCKFIKPRNSTRDCLEQSQLEVRAGGGLRITIFQVLQPNHPLPDGLLLSRVRVRARVYMILRVIAGIRCQISDQFVFFFLGWKGLPMIIYVRPLNFGTKIYTFISCHVTQRLVKFNSNFFFRSFYSSQFCIFTKWNSIFSWIGFRYLQCARFPELLLGLNVKKLFKDMTL